MLGAIAGDIVGSIYERHNIHTKEFPLFGEDCTFTDDSVMTAAVASALISDGDYAGAMRSFGRAYPDRGYGCSFQRWLFSADPQPYGSWGNGAAMRVSPVGWAFDTLEETERAARETALPTHNHPEGIRGAQAAAAAVFLARTGEGKAEIRRQIARRYGYDLTPTLARLRPGFGTDLSCQGTVPPALIAFLESDSYEDAVRSAVSLGGDSDTLAAIAGGVAEAAYGIPGRIRAEALRRLDAPLRDIVARFEERYPPRPCASAEE